MHCRLLKQIHMKRLKCLVEAFTSCSIIFCKITIYFFICLYSESSSCYKHHSIYTRLTMWNQRQMFPSFVCSYIFLKPSTQFTTVELQIFFLEENPKIKIPNLTLTCNIKNIFHLGYRCKYQRKNGVCKEFDFFYPTYSEEQSFELCHQNQINTSSCH